jgi:hypothetical protein
MEFRNTFINLCLPGGGRAGGGAPAAGRGRGATPDRGNWYAPPFRIFDNLYWLGTRQHSSWALQTRDGLIIIDTNFAWATEPEIIEGLTKLGLNPRDIKKARLIATPRQVGELHPFIVGAEAVQRYFTVMAECALASKLRLAAK